MDKLQFRDYLFSENPKQIAIAYKNHIVTSALPYKGEQSRKLAKKLRLITCKGCFFADTAEKANLQLEGLLKAGEDKNGGLLFIPGQLPFKAHLKECAVSWAKDGRVIPYTILFVEEAVLS